MPVDLSGTGCITSATYQHTVNGEPITETVSGIMSINCIPYLVQNAIFWLLVFAGTVALILIIIAGIKFITSGGDAKQAEGARKTLTFAILGLMLIMFSFAILRFIAQATGLDCITKFGFSQCTYTPKGVEGKPNEVTCDPDIHKKSCVGNGDHKRCFCEDKPPEETENPESDTSYNEIGDEGSASDLNCNPANSVIRCRNDADNCKCVGFGSDENLCYNLSEYCGPDRVCKMLVQDAEGFLGRCSSR